MSSWAGWSSPWSSDGRALVWRGFSQVKPGNMVKEVPEEAWARLPAGAGTKGPRLYDWARI